MKTHLFTLLFFLSFLTTASTQSCLPDGITFTTQGQIDSFPINYPGCTEIEGDVRITGFEVTSLDSLFPLESIVGSLVIDSTSLVNLKGLENLKSLKSVLWGGYIIIGYNNLLESLDGLNGLDSILCGMSIFSNNNLTNLEGLNNLKYVCGLGFGNNLKLENLTALGNLQEVNGELGIGGNALLTLSGLDNLKIVNGAFTLSGEYYLENLLGLNSIEKVYALFVNNNENLKSFVGLGSNLKWLYELRMHTNNSLLDLSGLEHLDSIGYLRININNNLTNLEGLENCNVISEITIFLNQKLSICSIDPICKSILLNPKNVSISGNDKGCNSIEEVALGCDHKILKAIIATLDSNDCLSAPNMYFDDFRIAISSNDITAISNCKAENYFGCFVNGIDSSLVSLLDFPTLNWKACHDTIVVYPALFGDTVFVEFLLTPLNSCPDILCDLKLPSAFRGCLVETPVSVSAQNIGTIPAENSIATIILPLDVMDVVASTPMPDWTNGDTLFYSLGDLDVFESVDIDLIVKTQCDTFLFGQTLCSEAFVTYDNPCDPDSLFGSIVTVHPQCIGDTIVEFALTNIGDAPTMNDHDYFIIEDEVILKMAPFTLNPMQQMTVQVQADGSTFRMEATKLDNGTLTAAAIEGCGGLNPGLINAYWVDQGELAYDYDCREVRLAYDPNEKSAVPTGVGPEHLMVANRPIQYTIDFQNTGTDTAYRVLIRDILPPQLDITTFRPLYATHDYSWQISGNDTLEFLFQPIALPDSAASQEGSKGFVTFTIDQLPNLPDGTTINNTANIIFDFNPPITTNTVTHTIGKLLVSITSPTSGDATWQVWGNPMTQSAIFKSKGDHQGQNQFILTDISGRIIQSASFLGSEYVFHRNGLSGGMYFFRIVDAQGGICAGRIVIAD